MKIPDAVNPAGVEGNSNNEGNKALNRIRVLIGRLAAYVSWMLPPTMFVYAYCMIRKGPNRMKLKPFFSFTLVIILAGAVNVSAESPAISQIRKRYQDTRSMITKGELLATKVDSVADVKYSDELAEHLDCSGPIVMFYWPERGRFRPLPATTTRKW